MLKVFRNHLTPPLARAPSPMIPPVHAQTPAAPAAPGIPPGPPPLNVIFFGSTGCGKSSIVNMLLDREMAPMSSGAVGCTFDNNAYSVTIEKKEYQLFDTTGLDEGTAGTVVSKDAILKLYQLLRSLQDGVTLLVYCMRGPRITETLERNYSIFHDGFCRGKVPIVIVITGLEDHEPDMDSWWTKNKEAFDKYKMNVAGHACITATRGKRTKNGEPEFRNDEEYNKSREVLRDLIVETCMKAKPWKLESNDWFVTILKWLRRNLPNWLNQIVSPRLGGLFTVLKHFMPESEARDIAVRADM
ncbi:hypothetical protein BT96DRAFT_934633 [Gymnopus androsaceus JB14]|uniref:G domain-containing protein n=1 Tax=Gymnopus androsaceus JB14 TaxID=1447944 RepID=A0A6A4I5R4_9AGAR|nr:hypothetical protein BT96DRAFT_934633 [Gymnopus androsaceus JB14]